MWLNMQLSGTAVLGPAFAWLAGLPLGPYKAKWPLANITRKPYISPRAQVACPDIVFGRGCFIDDYVTVYAGLGQGRVILGNRVHLNRGTIVEVGLGGQVSIGDDTHIQSYCSLSGYMGGIRIGARSLVAPGCGLYPYQHGHDDLMRPMAQQGLTSQGDIVMDDDVWLGTGVKVLEGVHIGHGAIVAAGAVVISDIPAYAVAVGVPARVVRFRGQVSVPDRERVPNEECG
jgi:acetyltransferase-like isoleucine patch superfamily enzyme